MPVVAALPESFVLARCATTDTIGMGADTDTKTTVAMRAGEAMAVFRAAGELAKSCKSAGR